MVGRVVVAVVRRYFSEHLDPQVLVKCAFRAAEARETPHWGAGETVSGHIADPGTRGSGDPGIRG